MKTENFPFEDDNIKYEEPKIRIGDTLSTILGVILSYPLFDNSIVFLSIILMCPFIFINKTPL